MGKTRLSVFYAFFFFSFLVFSTDTRSIYSVQDSTRDKSIMATPKLRVLFFDTFGTVLAQRKPVADELWRAAQQALESNTSSISSEVRAKASKMVCFSKLNIGMVKIDLSHSHTSSGSILEGLVADPMIFNKSKC
jgi:hypothetical protein